MIIFLINALKIIFLLGFLIFIHEGGHFLAAKFCGVTVNEFAIGFGPIIWKSKKTKTKYALRLIPLGGFVSMEGEVEKSEKEGSFSKASILKRIIIVAAGGVVNIIFALTVYFIFTASSGNFVGTTVKNITQNYEAEEAGIMIGDKIIKINNKRVNFKSEIVNILQKSNGEEITITVKRNNEKIDIKLTPAINMKNYTGIYLSETTKTEIVSIDENSPAQRYNLQKGDVILKVNGIDTENDPYKLLEIISSIEDNDTKFLISRNNQEIEIEVILDKIPTYVLGLNFKTEENTFLNRIKYGMFATKNFIVTIIEETSQLFTGEISTDQMSGPVGISSMIAKTKGIAEYIYLLALISLSLGVTNLLPFPPLDGGKIVLLLIESITRKPINERIEIGLQLVGFTLLIFLSLYVTYNDILRIFRM